MSESSNDDAVIRSMYGVFRIPHEDYIVTVKLRLIYRWIEPRAGDDVYGELKKLRASLKRMSNQRKVDMLYRIAQHDILLADNRFAPDGAKPPSRQRQDYISGWLPY